MKYGTITPKKNKGGLTRRDFLNGFFKAVLPFAALPGALAFPFLYPGREKTKARPPVFVRALEEEKLPRRGMKKVEFTHLEKRHRIYVARTGDGLYALSPRCTHLGCFVSWDAEKNEFACPCHGGRYDIAGNVIEGPPPAPLLRLPYKIEEGFLLIGLK